MADHTENLGLAPVIEESNPQLLKHEWGKKIHDLAKSVDLRKAPKGKSPAFMIRALRDPDGANLDRIQAIKGLARWERQTPGTGQ